jgi:hypothetical protein
VALERFCGRRTLPAHGRLPHTARNLRWLESFTRAAAALVAVAILIPFGELPNR